MGLWQRGSLSFESLCCILFGGQDPSPCSSELYSVGVVVLSWCCHTPGGHEAFAFVVVE